MAEAIGSPRGPGSGIPPEVRQNKRTISDLLPDKYEFSADTHLYIASSLPPDNQLCSTEEDGTKEGDGVHHDVDMLMGPTEHEDSPAVGDDDYVDRANTSIHADHPVDILLPLIEDVSTSLLAPAEESHKPQSFRQEAQQQKPGSVNDSQPVRQTMAPRMPTEPEPATMITVDTILEIEQDAAHKMLLQAVADLQAENTSLTKALSVQSQALQSLREAAHQQSTAEQTAMAQSELEDDKGGAGEQSADAGQEPEASREVAKTEALPRNRTEALYRSLELKVQQLKLERDAMERALRREVGDDMPLTKLLDAESDWRGRAQTIALLKEKLLSLHETRTQAMGNLSSARNPHDVNNRANLERLRGERAREAEELRAELASMRGALEDALHRLQGAAARKKALEKEVRSLKQKVVLLLDKSATDDSLIAALRSPAARLGAFASSSTISDQALCTAGGSFSAAPGTLTGPSITWEAPERGGSRVSMVVPGALAPEQAPVGEPLPTSAAESAPVQRTSFSISLDINTNTVSIQGLVTSPHRRAKSASAPSINPDSASCTPTELAIAGEESVLEDSEQLKGEVMGPEQIADIEEGSESLVEERCSPEEVVELGEEADCAQVAESYEVLKQCYHSDEAVAPLEDQEPAIEGVAETNMDSTDTVQPADMVAPHVTQHVDKHALHSTQVSRNKRSSTGEGNFTISTSGKNMVAGSNALEYAGTASEEVKALEQGHGQGREGNNVIEKAVEDAIAQVQQAVAEDGL